MTVRERRLPTWAETGLSSRGEHASGELLIEDMRLEKRILQEAGPVVTRPIRERIYPQGSGNRARTDVRLSRKGLHIGGGLLSQLDLSTTRQCHVEWDHADKILYIILAEDGEWLLPLTASSRLGGTGLVARLVDCGMKLGRYEARVKGNTIVVPTREGGQRAW